MTHIEKDAVLMAKMYFSNLHDNICNQKYNKTLPYSFHLDCVIKQAEKYSYLIPKTDLKDVYISCYGHDAIEDARMTYMDIREAYNEDIADIIYCCTEEKGKNRSERHSEKYYRELAQNKLAVFVKLCDIMANVKFSLLTNSSMFEKYKSEYSKTCKYLYTGEYNDIFEDLKIIFSLK